jgi:molybdopterin synthase sulfur carrier subunit
MPKLVFTQQLSRFTEVPEIQASSLTLFDVLLEGFARNPRLRDYILDEQNHLRQHVAVFIDGTRLLEREQLHLPLQPDSQVYVLQALSGG